VAALRMSALILVNVHRRGGDQVTKRKKPICGEQIGFFLRRKEFVATLYHYNMHKFCQNHPA
jgi:hypothetical protein